MIRQDEIDALGGFEMASSLTPGYQLYGPHVVDEVVRLHAENDTLRRERDLAMEVACCPDCGNSLLTNMDPDLRRRLDENAANIKAMATVTHDDISRLLRRLGPAAVKALLADPDGSNVAVVPVMRGETTSEEWLLWAYSKAPRDLYHAIVNEHRLDKPEPQFCDCERGHNGMGIAGRLCDCDERKPEPPK